MNKRKIISIALPIISVAIILAASFFLEPEVTGLVIYDEGEEGKVNADVILSTKASEVIPVQAIVEVWLDEQMASMSIAQFIKKTGEEYEVAKGEMPEFKFSGYGFTGDHDYRLSLADFDLNREIGKGEHVFKTRIKYRDMVLYEKENRIMIN
jgi:hypothetical protein